MDRESLRMVFKDETRSQIPLPLPALRPGPDKRPRKGSATTLAIVIVLLIFAILALVAWGLRTLVELCEAMDMIRAEFPPRRAAPINTTKETP